MVYMFEVMLVVGEFVLIRGSYDLSEFGYEMSEFFVLGEVSFYVMFGLFLKDGCWIVVVVDKVVYIMCIVIMWLVD